MLSDSFSTTVKEISWIVCLQAMLEEALPLAVAVSVALLPALAYGGLLAFRGYAILGAEESGFLKAIEEGKSEEEALKAAGVIASPAEPYQRRMPLVARAVERLTSPTYGFAARGLRQ